jgi:hypothetical protein
MVGNHPRVGGIGRSPIEFHKFARTTNWRNPIGANKTAMYMAYGTDQNVFEYLKSVGLGAQTNDHSMSCHQTHHLFVCDHLITICAQ